MKTSTARSKQVLEIDRIVKLEAPLTVHEVCLKTSSRCLAIYFRGLFIGISEHT